ncbi:MAG: hypothetical protein KGH59_03220 [Candidatus Micrarchaeota archaeon]|nr:hypothetical protein [Candidatus Micrarchaeota archaeon]MDE1804767.1 hypothetical protein [Candidatus Micrarchaeota archaeon]MDE1847014.1 hypothetical protein [Candidatus Micrarchaeota archaeon]
MNRYVKGARGERELLNRFYGLGYSVIRSAGSGVNSISPDILVVKRGKGFAFECKAWDKSTISIEHEKYEALKRWEENTGMPTFMAWRMSNVGWFFIRLDEMHKNDKSWSVTKKTALSIGRVFEHIASDQNPAPMLAHQA